VFIGLFLSVTLLDGRFPAGGLIWDFLNALGFCGLAALVYLGWDSESPARQPALRLHSNLAIVAALVTGAHLLGFLIWDPTVVEYLKLKAPWYMHAGLVGFVCVLVLASTSFPAPRKWLYGRFPRFRGWHLGLSIAALGLSVWHVLGAGFYLSQWYQQLALGALAIGVPMFAYQRRRTGRPLGTLAPVASVAHADKQSMLGLVVAIGLASIFAGLKNV
jgi:hypothetical protein